MRVTAKNLAQTIISAIPELQGDADENEDLYHLTFAELFRWTEQSVLHGNAGDLRRAICLVDSIFQNCDSDIRNAVAVSFLEYIDPNDAAGKQIFRELTPALEAEWHELDEYMKTLVGKSLLGQVARRDESAKK